MNNWQPMTIGQFLSLQRGYDLTGDEREVGNIPVVGAAGQNGFHNKALASAPGIVVGRCGGSFGQVYFSKEDFWPHNTAMFVTDFKGNDPYFAYYLLKNIDFSKLNSGSAQPSLNRNYIYPVKITVPKPPEQRKISAVLSALDAKIDCNNRINAELEMMAKTLHDYWFVQFDFPDANGNPYKSSGGKMRYNATLKREIPEGWTDGTLNDLGQIVGGSTPSTKNPDNFTTNGTPWITPNDLSDNQSNKFITRGAQDVSDEGIKDASLKKYPAGTVLLSSRAPIGYMAIARAELTTNQGFKSFIPCNGYSSAFIYYTVMSSMKAITQYASGSTFKEVSAAVLKTVKITRPEQTIVAKFSQRVEPIFRRQDLLEQENQQLTQLRDWLLPMLMNGQVTVA
ncbi:restriction endonuclease subunit S [Pseudomonas sp. B2M1-30]|uniref:restriction endonuclease subunit S n=1 Tax=Pseudomonas TaxID=286 RepID=UPI0021C89C9D|nr:MULTISPECIES: restriction endonuclease subunit S [Pseudomonas]MCU0119823.1 restriction endonuclease subunit S [Pseudomonas sp. B2M1-30]MCU7261681.1 restriction endonuclease subunit S [Pseudomonas koreensis]